MSLAALLRLLEDYVKAGRKVLAHRPGVIKLDRLEFFKTEEQ